RRAVAGGPGRRPLPALPVRAGHDVAAVVEGDDPADAHPVPEVGPDPGAERVLPAAGDAVGGGNGAGDRGRPVAPGDGPEFLVPQRADDDVVAVGERDDSAPPGPETPVAGDVVGEAVRGGHGAGGGPRTVAPRHRPVPTRPFTPPVRTVHDVVAVGQDEDSG